MGDRQYKTCRKTHRQLIVWRANEDIKQGDFKWYILLSSLFFENCPQIMQDHSTETHHAPVLIQMYLIPCLSRAKKR